MTRRLVAMGLALAGAGLLALPAAGQALPEGHTMDFEVEGTWVVTFSQGILHEGTLSGESTLGSYLGTYSEIGGSHFRVGTAAMEFPHGSLTIEYQYQWERPSYFWVGTYVVTGGTRSLDGATGEGILVAWVGTGPFYTLSGTLSR